MPATRHGFDDVITLAWAGRYHQYPRLGGLFRPRCRDNPPPGGLATPQRTCYATTSPKPSPERTFTSPKHGDLSSERTCRAQVQTVPADPAQYYFPQ